jgi:hypothetical protein
MSTAQIAVIEATDFAALSTASVMNLQTNQIVALTTADLAALATSQAVALMTKQIVALATDDLAVINTSSFAALLTSQIAALTTSQTAALTTAEMRAMTTTQMQGMTTNDIAALSTTQVAALTTCGFTALQTQALTANAKLVYTPIVLDLNGNGITTLAMVDGVQFDLLASGQPVQTGWVAPTDGLLVRDLSGDGLINNGTELFGNATVLADGSTASDGYQALAELDSNHDGVISAADAAYSQLGVWVDANSDGISEAGEVQRLVALGITEISVTAQITSTQDHGNTIGLTSSYQTADGVSHLAGDVWFATHDAAINAASLSTAAVAALGTDQLSAMSSVQVRAFSTVYADALQTQAITALGAADELAPMAAGSVTLSSTQAAQVLTGDKSASGPPPDVAPPTNDGLALAQRASALAQAIGTFELTDVLSSVATPSLNLPVDAYGGTRLSATLAVGSLVDQMRSFDSQAAVAASGLASMTTSGPIGMTAMQVAPVGLLNPLKNSVPNDFSALSGNTLQKP